MQKVLITGSSGFVGKNLAKKLETMSEYQVGVVDDSLDLTVEDDAMHLFHQARPDIVIHLAGKVGGIKVNQEIPATFMRDNLLLGINILECCREYNVKKLVNIGSVCGYPKYTPIPFSESYYWEGYPEETSAPYGIAKKTITEMAEVYGRQFDMDVTNLLFTNMYGEEDNFNNSGHVIPMIIKKIFDNPELLEIWGSGEVTRDFLYVGDAIDAIIKAMQVYSTEGVFNIGTGEEIKINELVKKIIKLTKYKGKVIHNADISSGQPRRCLDTKKANRILNWKSKISLNEGLKRTIGWYERSLDA